MKLPNNHPGISFKVSDVQVATEPLPMKDYHKALEDKVGSPIEAFPKIERKLNSYSEWHGFIQTLQGAFNAHYPVVITPDVVWLLIAQGFANHVNLYSEEMRNVFVDHEGKKVIEVRADHFIKGMNNDWMEVYPQFTKKINDLVKGDLLDLLVPTFSTTTAIEKAAFEVAMMDSMKSYFQYQVASLCGIPEVTILGSPDDWDSVLAHARRLRTYGLGWWVDALEPILEQFVSASKGNIDKDFWKSMYSYESMSGLSEVTGWVVNFFPYLHRELDDNYLKEYFEEDFDIVKKEVIEEAEVDEDGTEEFPAYLKVTYKNPLATPSHADIGSFPEGLSIVPFKWNYHGRVYDMEFISGFVGVAQGSESLRLSPEIGWCVREAQGVMGAR